MQCVDYADPKFGLGCSYWALSVSANLESPNKGASAESRKGLNRLQCSRCGTLSL